MTPADSRLRLPEPSFTHRPRPQRRDRGPRHGGAAATVTLLLCLAAVSCGGAATPAPDTAPGDVASSPPPAEPGDAMLGAGAERAAAADAASREAAAPADAGEPSAVVTDAASAAVSCWFGPSTQRPPDGAERPGAELLVRRTAEPAASRIVEETVRFDSASGVRPRLYTVVYRVDGDRFELAERDGGYSGQGTLRGDPWAWTAWRSVYTLVSGIRVEAEQVIEERDGEAVLHGERVAYGPDGSAALTLREELRRIDEDECRRRFAELPDAADEG